MLETISETKPLKAPLPPRPSRRDVFEGAQIKTRADYGDDQDPSQNSDDDEEYARFYTANQARKAAQQNKCVESPKSSSPGSDTSERCKTFVFNMSAGQEPLYGDPGEEDNYIYTT